MIFQQQPDNGDLVQEVQSPIPSARNIYGDNEDSPLSPRQHDEEDPEGSYEGSSFQPPGNEERQHTASDDQQTATGACADEGQLIMPSSAAQKKDVMGLHVIASMMQTKQTSP